MSTIPGNSTVTAIVGDAQSASLMSPSDVMGAVAAYLNSLNGQYTVTSTSYSGGMSATVIPLFSEEFQGTLNIVNNFSEDTSQLTLDIQAAFSEVSEGVYTPQQITITGYTPLPGSAAGIGVTVPTGQAAPTQTVSQQAAAATSSVAASVSTFWSQLGTVGQDILYGLIAIIILAVVLVAYGKVPVA
jgi:hypothetical protein